VTSADRELHLQRLGHFRGAGRDQNSVVWGLIGPAQRAVGMDDLDIRVSKLVETRAGLVGQPTFPFDRLDFDRDAAEHSCGVA
jgi:hypothetical protein